MSTKPNSASNESGNVRKGGGSYSNHSSGSRGLPNSAVHKPVPGQGGRGGKSR